MLDFVVQQVPSGILGSLLAHFEFDQDAETNVEAALYKTDVSFHAYFSKLVPVAGFANFMGEALLFNETGPNKMIDEQIDTRWVGNSLMRGAATLRWSKKHTRPKGLPALAAGFPVPGFLVEKAAPKKRSLREVVEGAEAP
jgi:hypothetical protein